MRTWVAQHTKQSRRIRSYDVCKIAIILHWALACLRVRQANLGLPQVFLDHGHGSEGQSMEVARLVAKTGHLQTHLQDLVLGQMAVWTIIALDAPAFLGEVETGQWLSTACGWGHVCCPASGEYTTSMQEDGLTARIGLRIRQLGQSSSFQNLRDR